jgi:hypothetical protein
VLSVVRQLTEAERSPITSIEQQHKAAVRDQLRQPPRHPCRVWQFEFRCKFARGGNHCHHPRLTLRLDVSDRWISENGPARAAASQGKETRFHGPDHCGTARTPVVQRCAAAGRNPRNLGQLPGSRQSLELINCGQPDTVDRGLCVLRGAPSPDRHSIPIAAGPAQFNELYLKCSGRPPSSLPVAFVRRSPPDTMLFVIASYRPKGGACAHQSSPELSFRIALFGHWALKGPAANRYSEGKTRIPVRPCHGASKCGGWRPSCKPIVPYEDNTLRSVCTRSCSGNGLRTKRRTIGDPMLAAAISSL